jgi:hypothetical protein
MSSRLKVQELTPLYRQVIRKVILRPKVRRVKKEDKEKMGIKKQKSTLKWKPEYPFETSVSSYTTCI